ncbi:MAG: hypothetical protein GQ556_09060, partial [Desulfobacterales bacterium]|nr:hypothetical protein [Desulfobacterales bacterium]
MKIWAGRFLNRRLGLKVKNFKQVIYFFLVIPLFLGINNDVFASDFDAAVQECLLKALENAPGSMTVDELRDQCQTEQLTAAQNEKDEGLIEQRLYTDEDNVLRAFTLMAHRPNYVLLASYNSNPNNDPWREASEDPNLERDNVEAQFQVSIKVPLGVDLFNDKMDIFAAYTVRSFWQVYNGDYSAPFRETNYEPEAWL